VPVVPPGSVVVVIAREELTVSVRARVAVRELPSAACTVKVELPAAVGVPLMSPALLRFNPAGRAPEASVHV
jgi:hypothetical protein